MPQPQAQPTWLTDALKTATKTPSTQSTPPETGQVRRLDAMDRDGSDSRLVLVTELDPGAASARLVLLSHETEMASNLDVSLGSELTGLPYDLIGLPDVSGPAWFVQLGPVLATLSLDVLNDPELRDAPELRDELDARWSWKEAEHDALLALTGECRRQMMDGEPDTVIDPVALDPDQVSARQFGCIAHATASLLNERKVRVATSALRGMVKRREPRSSVLWEPMRLLVEVLQRHSDSLIGVDNAIGETLVTVDLPGRALIASDALPQVVGELARSQPSTHRSMRVVTVGSLWQLDDLGTKTSHVPYLEVAPGVFDVTIAGARKQLVLCPVDTLEASGAA